MSISLNKKVAMARIAAMHFHAKQKRKYTNEPYYYHTFRVAKLVARAGLGPTAVCAALLHDAVEDAHESGFDPNWVRQQIHLVFGSTVFQLVKGLTDTPNLEGNRAFRKAYEVSRMSHQGILVQSIKCADLIDNTKTIVKYDPKFAKTYLQEKQNLLAVMDKADKKLLAMAQASVEAGLAHLEYPTDAETIL